MGERDWASLERGPLHDVFARLAADADAASFRHVCRGWRAAAGPGALVPGPWFVLQSAATADGRRAFVRPAGHRRVRPVLLDATAREGKAPAASTRGTSRGWLAVDDGGRLHLRDPVSRAEVPLPDFDDPGYRMSDIFLSDDPLAAPGRWTAFAFFKMGDDDVTYGYAAHVVVLAFCRPGDAAWARFNLNGQQVGFYWGLEFFRGRAYVLVGNSKSLAVCDVDTRTLVVSSVMPEGLMGWESDAQECLVECSGDLLIVVVRRCYEQITRSRCCVLRHYDPSFRVKVVKLEFAADGGGVMPVGASYVADTGDYALFVATHGHAFALPASEFPAVRPSCVYHFATNYTTKNVRGMVVTDLLDRTPKPLRKLPLAGKWHPLSWFWPRRPSLDTTPARRRR